MIQSSCKRDTKSQSYRGMKLAPVRIFSCKHPPSRTICTTVVVSDWCITNLAHDWWVSIQSIVGIVRGRNWPLSGPLRWRSGRFPFSPNFRKFRFGRKWKRFVGSSHWKIPRKSGKSKKIGPLSRLEFSERNFVFHLHVSRTLYQFQLLPIWRPSWCHINNGFGAVLAFTIEWNNFLPIR